MVAAEEEESAGARSPRTPLRQVLGAAAHFCVGWPLRRGVVVVVVG